MEPMEVDQNSGEHANSFVKSLPVQFAVAPVFGAIHSGV